MSVHLVHSPRGMHVVVHISGAEGVAWDIERARSIANQILSVIGEYETATLGTWTCPSCEVRYGSGSDSTIAHRQHGMRLCLSCTKQERNQ